MNINDLKDLLAAIRDGELSIDQGLDRLRTLPYEDAGIAQIDHHRALRQGVPEVVLGESKTTEQIQTIVSRMAFKCSAGAFSRSFLTIRMKNCLGGSLRAESRSLIFLKRALNSSAVPCFLANS